MTAVHLYVDQTIFITLSPVGVFCHIYLSSQPSRLCAACEIDCVSKQAVTRFLLPHNTSHNLPRMKANCNLQV